MIYKNAHELIDLIKKKELSSVELLEALLKRVEKVNPDLNAVVQLDVEKALEKAKQADKDVAEGKELGPLHGLPMTIKDAYSVEGVVSTGGNPLWKEHVPEKNAEAVQHLVDAGAIVFGKTNVPLNSADIQSYNDIYGVTNNPWDHDRTPGGSSGGSAASLASGMSPLELGSDIGGSIRTPAHFCGLFGHKPSYNIISEVGHLPPPPGHISTGNGLSVGGPLARSPEDIEIAMDVLAKPQGQDSLAWSIKLPEARTEKIEEIRIAVWPEEEYAEVDSEISSLIRQTASDLKSAGATVEEVPPPFTFKESDDVYSKLLNPLMLAGAPEETLQQLDQLAKEVEDDDMSSLAKTARGASIMYRDWVVVNAKRQYMRQQWKEFFTKYDVILAPVCVVPAFKHSHGPYQARYLTINGKDCEYWNSTLWAGPAVMANLPSTSTPIGLTESGLPVGLQVTGPFLEDKTCIAVSKMIRDVRGGFRIPQGYEID
jgi:amidase